MAKKTLNSISLIQELTNLINREKNYLDPNKPNSFIATSRQRQKSIKQLVKNLRQLRNDFPKADSSVRESIPKLAQEIEQGAIAFSNTLRIGKQKSFGRTHIMSIFGNVIEPVIVKSYPKFSQGYLILNHAKLWPLKTRLMSGDSLKKIITRLHEVISDEDSNLEENPKFDPRNQYMRETLNAVESMSLILAAMMLISAHIPDESIAMRWCEFCFRRTSESSHYCPSHDCTGQNTNFKRGKRVADQLPPKIRIMTQRYQHLRVLMGDEPVFINSDVSFIDDAIRLRISAAVSMSNIEDHALYLQTLSGDWAAIKPVWVSGIQTQLPHLSRVLRSSNYDCASSWEVFVSEIFNVLHEQIETTKFPSWILHILILADAWLEYELKFADRRPTGKKALIYQLADKNIIQERIAEIVDVDPSYVSRILKHRIN